MTLADSNIWLALVLSAHEHHSRVSEWFVDQGPKEVAFCRMTQISFLRLLTTRAVLSTYGNPPLTNEQASALYDGLLRDPRVSFASEPSALDEYWSSLTNLPSSSPKLWMDAYLAAFAISGRHQLVTIDAGFTQFRDLNLVLLQ